MQEPKQNPEPEETVKVQISVPKYQSSIIIPPNEIEALKHMNRIERKKWGVRKKYLLGQVIDQYVTQAAISRNGKVTE